MPELLLELEIKIFNLPEAIADGATNGWKYQEATPGAKLVDPDCRNGKGSKPSRLAAAGTTGGVGAEKLITLPFWLIVKFANAERRMLLESVVLVPFVPMLITVVELFEIGMMVRPSQTSVRLSVESYHSVPFVEQLPPIVSPVFT